MKARARDETRRAAGLRVRTWVAGPASSYTPVWGLMVCDEIEAGATLSAVVAMPGMPSSKAVYAWMRKFPAFRAQYIAACERREDGLDVAIEATMEGSTPGTLAAARRRVAYLEGRIGRLTPKIYRFPPAPWR